MFMLYFETRYVLYKPFIEIYTYIILEVNFKKFNFSK